MMPLAAEAAHLEEPTGRVVAVTPAVAKAFAVLSATTATMGADAAKALWRCRGNVRNGGGCDINGGGDFIDSGTAAQAAVMTVTRIGRRGRQPRHGGSSDGTEGRADEGGGSGIGGGGRISEDGGNVKGRVRDGGVGEAEAAAAAALLVLFGGGGRGQDAVTVGGTLLDKNFLSLSVSSAVNLLPASDSAI